MPSVKIRIERGQEQAGDGNGNILGNKDEKKNVSATSIFAHQMVNTAKQIVSYSASNVGNFTGNYVLQDEINTALDLIGDASTIAMGFVAGGWVGGVIAIAGITTKQVFKAISSHREDVVVERDRNYLLARSGNSTTNGSRGTEN